jgi:hypothetical protein
MKTVLSTLKPEFAFAGFTFPKHVWTLPCGSMAKRLDSRKPVVCGAYYHAPKPNTNAGMGFYLASDGAPNLRWQWADEVIDLAHGGWYSDAYGNSELIRGVVFRLPHGRGFLAGWSMGEGMSSQMALTIYADAESAACTADAWAEDIAEAEREYQASQAEEIED